MSLPHPFTEYFESPGTCRATSSTRFNVRDANDIYSEFFGGGSTPFMNLNQEEVQEVRFRSKAPPIESKLVCKLEELYNGASRKLKISRSVVNAFGDRKTVKEILKVDIKAGWKKGTKITFAEKGNQEPGVTPADLVFVVDEEPHSVFKRDGDDLVVNKKLLLLEALTGKTFSLSTLDGRNITVPVADVVKPGDEVVIRNEGMPVSKEAGKRGNLVVKFEILFPARLSAEQKAYVTKGLAGMDDR